MKRPFMMGVRFAPDKVKDATAVEISAAGDPKVSSTVVVSQSPPQRDEKFLEYFFVDLGHASCCPEEHGGVEGDRSRRDRSLTEKLRRDR